MSFDTDPAAVRLDASTDAGEFVCQNLTRLPRQEQATRAFDAICLPEPTPSAFFEAVGLDTADYDRILQGLGEYGMEFESMGDRGDFSRADAALAERGIRSAEQFVRAARDLARTEREVLNEEAENEYLIEIWNVRGISAPEF